MQRLALKRSARQLRLWGKIIGSERDYYIAEGQADGGEEAGELGADVEPKGTGANKWTYWASNDLTGEWTELPLATPAQLRIARKIKYIFTGDLSRAVLSNPLFPGKEAHLVPLSPLSSSASWPASRLPASSPPRAPSSSTQSPTKYKLPKNTSFPK